MPKIPKNIFLIIYPLFLIVLTILFSYPSLYYPFGTDQGVFAYVARMIIKGDVPYKDVWDIKPPGIYFLYALGMKILGDSMVAIRIFDLFFTILNVLLIFYIVRKLFNEHSAFLSGFFYGFYYYVNDFWTLGQVENFLNFFVLLNFLFLYLAINNRRINPTATNTIFYLLAGVFSGLTVWFKQTAIFFPIISIYLIIIHKINVGNGRDRSLSISEPKVMKCLLKNLVLFFIGSLLVSLIFIIYFSLRGGWSDFVYTILVWDRHYGAIVYKGGLIKFLNAISVPVVYFVNYHLPFVILSISGLIISLIKKRDFNHHFVLCCFLAGFLCIVAQGKFFYYHWIVCYIPMSIFAANFIYSSLRNYKKIYPVVILIVAIILIYAYTVEKYIFSFKYLYSYKKGAFSEMEYRGRFGAYGKMEPGHFSIQAMYEVTDYIKSHTSEKDPILVFSFSSLPYYLSKREAPTRFFFNVPVIVSWVRNDWRDEFVRDIRKRPPKYFIFIEGDAIPWASGVDKDSFYVMRDWEELSEFFSQNYLYETQIEFFKLYKLRN